MMRTSLIVVSLLHVGVALAEDRDAAFRDIVGKYANENKQYVEAWWAANLDADPALERVAVVCPLDKEDHKGYFLIEKDASHRWELTFDFDSRTRACKGKPAEPPKWEQRKSTMIELYQGHLAGYEATSFALRVGQPVIVRDEVVEKQGGKPDVKDWDQLVKKKKAKSYQSPDSLRPLNN